MKRLTIALLTVTVTLPACSARHAAATIVPHTLDARPSEQDAPSPDLWRRVAEKLTPGTDVLVQTTDGSRHTGVFLTADATAMSVRPRTRVPAAVQQIPFDRIAHVDIKPSGATLAQAAAVGTGAGLGPVLGLLLLMSLAWD